MSRYEWEAGTLKFPVKAYKPFKHDLAKAWNAWQMDKLAKARNLWLYIKQHKLDPNKLEYLEGDTYNDVSRICGDVEQHELLHLILKDGKIVAPKKKDLDCKQVYKFVGCYFDEVAIQLSDTDRTVRWSVDEHNHACETAREHHMGQQFFALLRKVKWTRGTGGKIVGNDEYNRDEGGQCEGGGGSYVTAEYGPKAESAMPGVRVMDAYPRSSW
jgi:hypothetical protein